MFKTNNLKFDSKGLIPAIIQHYQTKRVLMLGYMNEESLQLTIETKKTWFYSRSRNKLWNKGETSGNFQNVVSIDFDCDSDSLLIQVIPQGPTCHTGNYSCFYQKIIENESLSSGSIDILNDLYSIIMDRKSNPKEGSYTNYLFDKGIDKILKKVGEESAETIIASKNEDKGELIYESSDLIYHLMVLFAEKDVTLEDIYSELNKRFK